MKSVCNYRERKCYIYDHYRFDQMKNKCIGSNDDKYLQWWYYVSVTTMNLASFYLIDSLRLIESRHDHTHG